MHHSALLPKWQPWNTYKSKEGERQYWPGSAISDKSSYSYEFTLLAAWGGPGPVANFLSLGSFIFVSCSRSVRRQLQQVREDACRFAARRLLGFTDLDKLVDIDNFRVVPSQLQSTLATLRECRRFWFPSRRALWFRVTGLVSSPLWAECTFQNSILCNNECMNWIEIALCCKPIIGFQFIGLQNFKSWNYIN